MRDLAELLAMPLPALALPKRRSASISGAAHQRGMGEEYWQLRPYAAGDAPRSISWRASARTETPLIVERNLQAQPRCILALDAGAPDAALAGKLETMALLMQALAYRLIGAGFQVRFSGSPQPASMHLPRLKQQVDCSRWSPGMPATLLLTPLLQPLERLKRCAALGARVVCLLGAGEQELPGSGMLRLSSSQGCVTLGDAGMAAPRYKERLSKHQAAAVALGGVTVHGAALPQALRQLWTLTHAA